MFRYVSFLWDRHDSTAIEAAQTLHSNLLRGRPEWRVAFAVPGMVILCTGRHSANDGVCVLAGSGGVILGTLFSSIGDAGDTLAQRLDLIEERESAQILRSGGRRLVERYWGSYVAFLHDPSRERRLAIIAPMGQLACFTTVHRGVTVYFSRMEDCIDSGISRFTLDWSYLAAQVALNVCRSTRTGLAEVAEVVPGQCVEHGPDRVSTHQHWDPVSIVREQHFDDAALAAMTLHQTAKVCIQSWGAQHRRLIHMLSGGLDSSIVLGCMAAAPDRPQITCINDYSDGSNSDERHFARMAARFAQCELIEHERDAEIRLEDMLQINRTAIPYVYFMMLSSLRPATAIAHRVGATGIFDGTLGDEIFYRKPTLPTVADFVRLRGLRTQLAHVALDVARLERLSVWSVLGNTAAELLMKPRHYFLSVDLDRIRRVRGKSIVNLGAIQERVRPDELVHPWFRSVEGVPPGKLWQLNGILLMPLDNPIGAPEDPDIYSPLGSQPLVELCLRIPTFLHLSGGRDRNIARQAFHHEVPGSILQRITKGGVEEHGKELIIRSLRFIREFLLDGVLVRERLLNADLLDDALSARPSRSQVVMGDIMSYLGFEVWLKAWSHNVNLAAAA
jgi:asparagine synthase (glutamine-hydrolysing)